MCVRTGASMLQVAAAAYVPRAPVRGVEWTGHNVAAQTRARVLSGNEARPPHTWSEYEAAIRTGMTAGPGGYMANDNGGCPCRIGLYYQDKVSGRSRKRACKQQHASTKKLAPGLLVRAASNNCLQTCHCSDLACPGALVITKLLQSSYLMMALFFRYMARDN